MCAMALVLLDSVVCVLVWAGACGGRNSKRCGS